jgi:hypothetical protein
MTTSKSTFPMSDSSDLPARLAGELELQLLSFAEQTLTEQSSGSGSDGRVFVDELDGVITLPHGYLR